MLALLGDTSNSHTSAPPAEMLATGDANNSEMQQQQGHLKIQGQKECQWAPRTFWGGGRIGNSRGDWYLDALAFDNVYSNMERGREVQ